MKMEKITVNFNSEKLLALQVLKPEVYEELEKLLQEHLEKIYVKYVPQTTRQYIEAKEKFEFGDSSKGGNK